MRGPVLPQPLGNAEEPKIGIEYHARYSSAGVGMSW